MALGFTVYQQESPPAPPTVQELLSELSGAQKTSILDGFAKRVLPKDFRMTYNNGIPTRAVRRIYQEIDNIESTSRTLLRGEKVITPAEYDQEGNITTPAVYNTPPATLVELKSQVAAEYQDVFTEQEVGAVIDKMIEYCALDASGNPVGTAQIYNTEVVK